jgi:hypothetical protein
VLLKRDGKKCASINTENSLLKPDIRERKNSQKSSHHPGGSIELKSPQLNTQSLFSICLNP